MDGAHHYSLDGERSGTRYADNMRGDRELKLNGYEVFRFGATELPDVDSARAVLEPFCADLFRQVDVTQRV